jgi:hypothetical protein
MPDIAFTRTGLVRLTANTIRNDPTPAVNRLTMYQNLLFGGASSEYAKICCRHDAGTRSAIDPLKVPRVKKTKPVTKFVRS